MLAVRSPLQSIRRADLETSAGLEQKNKFLCAVFYRPHSTGTEYMKAFKRFLRNTAIAHFYSNRYPRGL